MLERKRKMPGLIQTEFGIAVDNTGVTISDFKTDQIITTYVKVEKGDTYEYDKTLEQNGVSIRIKYDQFGFEITTTTQSGQKSTIKITID
jgi:hypothetical protein